ncbi:hypothetical protein BDN72DRAFT_905941 [Pluteus cervinus]|uniref:Uncharacterized protein n=1 Tax=Pluteus cervinus TaxID=181527 RepID=A0ACD3A211_9AGAR|nr:hypothetical protein BDN72DRAFT_905941 [Pluteus cervinus]
MSSEVNVLIPEVICSIVDVCAPLAVVRLSQTSHRIHKIVTEYLPHRYSAFRVLGRFLTSAEYDSLRSMQCRLGLLIVGSAALNVFDPTTQMARGLDLMVHMDFKEEVEGWLKSIGYDILKPQVQVSPRIYAYSPLCEILHFIRENGPEGYKREVYLFVTRNTPMEVILTFDLTCNMHFLTGNDAVSLYPFSTFVEHKALRIYTDPGIASFYFTTMYELRGWTVIRSLTRTQRDNSKSDFFVPGQRYIGDKKSWIVPCTIGEPLPELHPLRFTNSWQLRFDHADGLTETSFELIRKDPFKFTYVMADDLNIQRVVDRVLPSGSDQLLKQALEKHFG